MLEAAENVGARVWACRAHLVARADSNAEVGSGVEVQDVERVGVGLELAQGGAVQGVLRVVLVSPALEV